MLDLANRLTAGGPRGALTTTRPAGPEPTIDQFTDPDAELAGLVKGIRRLLAAGVSVSEIAVLVRINAQLPPIEDALTRAGVEYTVRGQRFYQRSEVREARTLIRRAPWSRPVTRWWTRCATSSSSAWATSPARTRSARRPASAPRRSRCC